jgi:hypothetical protein
MPGRPDALYKRKFGIQNKWELGAGGKDLQTPGDQCPLFGIAGRVYPYGISESSIFKFKNIAGQLSLKDLSERLFLEKSLNKPISYFSSGMKQRLKLGICFFLNISINPSG